MGRGVGFVVEIAALLVLVIIITVLLIDLMYPRMMQGVGKAMQYIQYTVLKLTDHIPKLTVGKAMQKAMQYVQYAIMRLTGQVPRPKIVAPKPAPLMIPSNIDVYVVGPTSLVNRLVSMGAPPQLVRQIALSQLSAIPSNSIVVIDWDYVNETLHMNYKQLSGLLEAPIGNGNLVILTTNNTSMRNILTLEDAIAVAWGNRWHAKVIGYPVIGVGNTSAVYVIGYGARGLMINVVPQYTYTTNTLNNIISEWARLQGIQSTAQTPLRGPSTYTNVDPCDTIANSINGLDGQYGWFFYTGPVSVVDKIGNEFEVDYCIYVPNAPVSLSNSIFVGYYGYSELATGPNGGGWSFGSYQVGINMMQSYQIDQLDGFNSYMGWEQSIGYLQPWYVGCSTISKNVLEELIQIAGSSLEFIFEVLTGDARSAGFTSSISVSSSSSNAYLSNIVWNIGIYIPEWLFCAPASTSANTEYPVGWANAGGVWLLNGGANNVNVAASPIIWSSITLCQLTSPGYYNESVYSDSTYFIMEYNPSGSGYTIMNLKAIYANPPVAQDNVLSSSCS